MVGTIFKGDVAEVSWGKETGLMAQGTGSATGFAHTTTSGNTSLLTIGTGVYWHTGSGTDVEIPDNALVGCILRITGGGNFGSDDYASTRRTYYVIANDTTNGTITVQPALATGTGINGAAGDILVLDNNRCPTFESAMTDAAQQVKTDQFFGLLDNFSLPEPEIDVRKQHIVGMGRDVNVLTSGRETLAGGSFTVNAHTLRWMKYALGGHVAKSKGEFAEVSNNSDGSITDAELPLNIKQNTSTEYRVQVFGGTVEDDLTGINTDKELQGLNSATISNGDNLLIGAKTTAGTPGEVKSATTFTQTHEVIDITNGGIYKTLGASGEVLYGSFTSVYDGKVSSINTIVGGSGYTAGSSVATTGGTGTGLTVNTTVVAGAITGVVIATSGSGYSVGDTITVSGGSGGTFDVATILNELRGCSDIDTGAQAIADDPLSIVYCLAPLQAAIARRDVRVNLGSTIAAKFAAGDYIQIVDKDTHTIPGQDDTLPTVRKNEIRRVIAVDGAYVYVEEPFFLAHSVGSVGVERLQYASDDSRGSPNIVSTTKELQFGVEHTLFGDTSLPTFMIEQSFRRDNATPGTEQLLRLYNGCKVGGMSFSANTEGEVKLQVDYEGGRHYTDTANAFTPHRMFENTANSAINRKASGIAVNGEKPYLFQDLSFEVFGRPVLRATQIEFSINNTNTARHFIRGYEGNTTDSDQVQLAGVQMPLDITEAQREYTFSFSAMIEDDQLWEQIRTRKHHQNTNDITLTLKKRGSNSTRENATITIEDYTITKADHQIPDDKGAVIVQVELVVRHLKVVENSVYFTL